MLFRSAASVVSSLQASTQVVSHLQPAYGLQYLMGGSMTISGATTQSVTPCASTLVTSPSEILNVSATGQSASTLQKTVVVVWHAPV